MSGLDKTECNLQKVQADQGNLSHRAVLADPQYRADQPNPEDLKDQEDPDRIENTMSAQFMAQLLSFLKLLFFLFIIYFFHIFLN